MNTSLLKILPCHELFQQPRHVGWRSCALTNYSQIGRHILYAKNFISEHYSAVAMGQNSLRQLLRLEDNWRLFSYAWYAFVSVHPFSSALLNGPEKAGLYV